MYVPTALIPNIAASTTDDSTDEVTAANYMQWPFKPILLFGAEGNTNNIISFRAQI